MGPFDNAMGFRERSPLFIAGRCYQNMAGSVFHLSCRASCVDRVQPRGGRFFSAETSNLLANSRRKKDEVEKLWHKLFSNPSDWCDHRLSKLDPRFADFKHKKTQESLWLDSKWIPPWVETKLHAIAPGTLGSVECSWDKKHVLPDGGKKAEVEKLWQKLFSNPSEWWDYRLDKVNPRFPDFKNKKTEESLWLNSKWMPQWVEAKLAVTAPGTWESSIFPWNQRLSKYAKTGQYEETMKLFEQMQRDGINSDRFTFVPVLNACAGLGVLEDGRHIHMQITQSGFETDLYVGTALIHMYAKCGSTGDAHRVFNKMSVRNVVVWNAMIGGFVKCREGQKALELFETMQQEGVNPNPVTFVLVLNACANVGSLQEGKCAHKQIIEKGYDFDVFVSNSLVDMYAKCRSIVDAEKVFNKMTSRNVVSWTTMILGYVKSGQGQKALELFQQMQHEQVVPNHVTFVGVLHACANMSALKEGRQAHEQIRERGYESNIFVSNTLIDMYAKCSSIEDAWRVFSDMPTRNVVAWNTMIGAYVKCGKGLQALELYGQMQHEGVIPNTVTFMAVLNACACVTSLQEGRRVHKQIIERGYDSDVYVSNSLVNMYSKCGSIEDAERIFNALPTKNVVAWNAMIGGCVKCGKELQALELYGCMQQEGVDPDHVTFMAVLNACAGLPTLEEGRRAHEQITEKGYGSDVVLSNCLIDMYSRCGSLVDAQRVFNEMSARNVVAWNAIIGGYVRCGKGRQALELFRQMELEKVDPDPLTFVAVLNACASVATLEEGRRAHEQIIERGFGSNIFLNNCLVDMYAKCGSIQEAEGVLSKMPSRDVVGWTAMILGYVKCGKGQEALELFEKMRQDGLQPDRVTFVAVLNACASVAALEEGRRAHEQIIDRGYESDVVVSNCLVDMYVKCGSIEDAQRLFNRMATRDVVSWTAMLAGYASNGYVREAIKHFEQMCEVVKVDGITFISLFSACSHGGLVDAGLEYFKSMTAVFNILPELEHYACVVDLLGRAGHLQEAEDLIISMPIEPDATMWMSLLAACRVHGNMEMGKHCAKRALELNPDNAAGYALLSNVHAASAK